MWYSSLESHRARKPLTHVEALELDEILEHLLVIGVASRIRTIPDDASIRRQGVGRTRGGMTLKQLGELGGGNITTQ
jgi:hypothetical protein